MTILKNLKIDRSCIVATEKQDMAVYKSLRNIPKVDSLEVSDLNAGVIFNHQKILFTRSAIESIVKAS